MTTIIVPIDFSVESESGLDMAIMLANKMDAKIEMVHVITDVNSNSTGDLSREHNLAEKSFQEIITKFESKGHKNIDLNYIIKEGKIFKEVSNQAASYKEALIVLSTHGLSGFEELFIGGNAYKITSISMHPVISVRKRNVPESIKKIVMPLDFTLQTKEKVNFTSKLAKFFNSEIHVVTVRSTNLKSIEKKLLRYSKQVGTYLNTQQVPFTIEHLYGSNLTDITIDYARSINADLISIMSEQEKSLSNLLLGNYAHQMINNATIPVLTNPTSHHNVSTVELRTQGVDYE